MTDDEIILWNAERLRLFEGARIPQPTLAAILNDARQLDYDRAMRALARYRAQRPYKGFWADAWAKAYNDTPSTTGQTDGHAARAAAARLKDRESDLKALAEQRAEIDAYRALPQETRDAAARTLQQLGYTANDNDRAWRFIVLEWVAGRDVERFRVVRPSHVVRKEIERETLIRELRALLVGTAVRLRDAIDGRKGAA